jgi:5-hydroxyisourate hydrolase
MARSPITTHILDTAAGRPAAGVSVSIAHLTGAAAVELARAATDADGRVMQFDLPALLPAGLYRITFETGDYYAARGIETFYPRVEVHFTLANPGQHYHVPLLLSPWGYSTYRGS